VVPTSAVTVIEFRAIIIYNEEKSTLLNVIVGSLALKIRTFFIEDFCLKGLSF